jgi:hypothetical protein
MQHTAADALADAIASVALNGTLMEGSSSTARLASAVSSVALNSSLAVPAPAHAALVCSNVSPLQRAWQTPLGGEAFWAVQHHAPSWVLLSHSAQGVLGLFSMKHVLLLALPAVRGWIAKFNSLRTNGVIVSSRHSRLEAGNSVNAHAAEETSSELAAALLAVDLPVSAASSSSASASAVSASSSSSLCAAAAVPSPRTARRTLLQQLYVSSASDKVASLGSNMLEHILSFLNARELALVMSNSKTFVV